MGILIELPLNFVSIVAIANVLACSYILKKVGFLLFEHFRGNSGTALRESLMDGVGRVAEY
jgi:hypothetical protein